jgi:hypothetical protein
MVLLHYQVISIRNRSWGSNIRYIKFAVRWHCRQDSHTTWIVRVAGTVSVHRLEPGIEDSHRTTPESKRLVKSPETIRKKLHRNEGIRITAL